MKVAYGEEHPYVKECQKHKVERQIACLSLKLGVDTFLIIIGYDVYMIFKYMALFSTFILFESVKD